MAKMTDPVEVKCYGKWYKYPTRRKAMNHFMEGMLSTEGAESARYMHIYQKLGEGYKKCTDDLETTAEDVM